MRLYLNKLLSFLSFITPDYNGKNPDLTSYIKSLERIQTIVSEKIYRQPSSIDHFIRKLFGRVSASFSNEQTKACSTATSAILQEQTPAPTHAELVDLLLKLYGDKASKEGLCHGFALMGMQAVFLEDVNGFNERLKQLGQLLQSALAEGKTHEDVIRKMQEDKDSDMLPFLEGLQVCMMGHMYPGLTDPETGPKTQQDSNFTENFMSIIAPKTLEDKGKVTKIKTENESGVYTESDLTSYFKNLKKNVKDTPAIKDPIAVKLGSYKAAHAITVGYDPTKDVWFFINASNGYIESISGDEDIAKKVMNGYAASKLSDGSIALSHQIYAVNGHTINLERKDGSSDPELSVTVTDPEKNQEWLLLACHRGDLKSTEKLIEAKVDLNIQDSKTGKTPLHEAVIEGHKNVVRALMDAGADVNIQDKNGNTPLHIAIGLGRIDVALALIEAENIRLDIKDSDNKTPFDLAFIKELQSVAQAIEIRGSHPDVETSENKLFNSVISGEIETVRTLIRQGANPNIEDSNGNTPLHLAIAGGNTEIALALLEAENIDLSKRNSFGASLYFAAIYYGQTKVAEAIETRSMQELFKIGQTIPPLGPFMPPRG